jgi:uncharacterized protein (TIGR02246 family)
VDRKSEVYSRPAHAAILVILRMKTLLFLTLLAGAVSSAFAADKLFAVQFTTGPGWDASKPFPEQKHLKEHSANLNRMWAEGLIVMGGRHGEVGHLVMRAADEAALRAQLAQDLSIAAGTFNAKIEEYRPFFGGQVRAHATTPEVAVVRAALAAYNKHDAAAVAALYADDIAWFSVGADGKQSVEGDGREAIEKWLTGYFKNLPDVRAEITDVTQTGSHVSFRERVTWTAKDGTKRAQSSIGIYEVRDGKVKRAWYFPSAREAAPAPK